VTKWVLLVVGLLVLTIAGFAIADAHRRAQPYYQAEQACQEGVRLRSINPSTVKFGGALVQDGDPGRTDVIWTRTDLQMQNRFGAMIGASATCTFDNKTGAVVHLDIMHGPDASASDITE
jgi:hypothetical protein